MRKITAKAIALLITLTATITLAITLTLTACEEKKKQDGTTTTAPEPAAEAATQQPATQEAVAEKPAEKGGGGDMQGGCPNAVTGNGTLTCGGQTYKTVKIGEQVWMAENLNFEVKNGSWCYDDKADNCKKYGRLYNWETVNEVCPKGWHLPSNQEWDNLVTLAGGVETAGKKLKSKSGWVWNDENINGTDDYGFSALPGGARFTDNFNGLGSSGFWRTADGDGYATDERDRFFRIEYVDEDGHGSYGYSIRCIKD